MTGTWESITMRAVLLAAAAATGAAQMSPGMEVEAGIRPRVATVGIETAVGDPTSFPLGSAFSTVPGVRPLTIDFFGGLPSRDAVTNNFVLDELLPAATAVLARSVQVSHATPSSLPRWPWPSWRTCLERCMRDYGAARRLSTLTGGPLGRRHALGGRHSHTSVATTRHSLRPPERDRVADRAHPQSGS